MADFAVSGRVAVVTGASRGIGEAIARELSRRGASVGLLARAEHDLERVTGVIRRAGGRAEWLACDLSDTASAAAAIATLSERLGPVDILVNNAGAGLYGRVDEVSEETLGRLFALNVLAPHALTRAVIGDMKRRKTGVIVNVSSVLGKQSIPLAGGYAATKFALEALSESLRAEVAGDGVRVLVVRPGRTQSNFQRAASAPHGDRPPENMVPAMRPDDVAIGTCDAIERGASAVSFTVAGKALLAIGRISPALTESAMRVVYRRLSRKAKTKAKTS